MNTSSLPPEELRTQNCDAVLELIPAYAIGATDAAESAFVRAHLANCPDAAAELERYAALADGLHAAVPHAQAPLRLLDALMVATTPPIQAPVARFRARGLTVRLSLALAAASLLIVLFAALYWQSQWQALRAEQAALAAQIEAQQQLLALVGADTAQRVVLPAATGVAEDVRAAVICNPYQSVGLLYAEQFPALRPDQTYQIWLIRGESRVSGGLFTVDARGSGTVIFRAPEAIGNYEAIGITPEPAGGSAAPTAPPVVRGLITYPDL